MYVLGMSEALCEPQSLKGHRGLTCWVGKATTSQARQPLALRITPNYNITDTCSSCSAFKLAIASSSEAKGEGLPKRVSQGIGGTGCAGCWGFAVPLRKHRET